MTPPLQNSEVSAASSGSFADRITVSDLLACNLISRQIIRGCVIAARDSHQIPESRLFAVASVNLSVFFSQRSRSFFSHFKIKKSQMAANASV